MTEPNLKTILEDYGEQVVKLMKDMMIDSPTSPDTVANSILDTALKAILSTHIPLSECEKIIGEDETTQWGGLFKEKKPSVADLHRNALRKEQRLALKHLIEEKLK